MIYVRRMLRDDCPWAADVEAHTFPRGFSRHWFKDAVLDDGIIKLVAQIGEEPVGYIVCLATPIFATIEAFAVCRLFRRKMAGGALLDRLSAELAKAGIGGLQAGVCERQIDGQLFLRSKGFKAGKLYRGACACGYEEEHDLIEFSRAADILLPERKRECSGR